MKNFKIYKSALALITSASILLLSGCSSNTKKEEKKEQPKNEYCHHLTIYFEDEPITFKQCEGYEISASTPVYSGECSYSIYKDKEKVLSGTTSVYNEYFVYHNVADNIIENKAIQKVK
jgi:hypothetical protein